MFKRNCKIIFLLSFAIKEYAIQLEVSSPPHFRIQGGPLSVKHRQTNKWMKIQSLMHIAKLIRKLSQHLKDQHGFANYSGLNECKQTNIGPNLYISA